MENLLSNALVFNNDELNNNGASSNICSGSNSNSGSCWSDSSSIFSDLLRCHNEPINVILENSEEQDAIDESLAKFKTVSDETTIISEVPSATDTEEEFIVTPDEKKNLEHFLVMNFVKKLHVHIFFQQECLAIRLKGK